MKTPELFGRPMEKVKEYDSFILFVDKKTNIHECYSYFDLGCIKENYKSIKSIDDLKLQKKQKNKTSNNNINIKNDNRLWNLLDDLL